jgi:hypothetical protein
MIIVGASVEWPRHQARTCHRCRRATWVDPILLDFARRHREDVQIVCEPCHRRGPPADRPRDVVGNQDHEEARP